MSNNIAHRWIHEIPHGRTGAKEFTDRNWSYHQNKVYSYSTVIGQYFDTAHGRIVLLNQTSYSNTTAKHQSAVRYATNHLTQLTIHETCPFRFYGYGSMDEAIRRNVGSIIESVHVFLAQVKKGDKKSLKEEEYTRHLRYLRNAFAWLYYATFDVQEFLSPSYIGFELLRDGAQLIDNFWLAYLKAHQEFGKYSTNDAIRAEWARQEQITANRRAGALRAADTRRTNERKSPFDRLREKFGIERPEQSIDLWRNRKINSPHIISDTWPTPVYLRVNNGTVETSRGASVPIDLDRFKTVLTLINRAEAEQISPRGGIRLGHFSVDGYDHEKQILAVGCHKIPKSEIEYIAKQLELAPDASEVTA